MHRHILIEAVTPSVDGGRYSAKAVAGEPCVVEADIFRDGHGLVRAVIRWQKKGDERYFEAPMRPLDNDRFRGEFPIYTCGSYRFSIEAWTDTFASFTADFEKKALAGRDLALDRREAVLLLEGMKGRATGSSLGVLTEAIARLEQPGTAEEAVAALSREELSEVVAALDEREDAARLETEMPVFAAPRRARFSTWYELFPRSELPPEAGGLDAAEGAAGANAWLRGATLRDATRRLPKLAAMGFDVLYLAPVHPIGVTARKGKDGADTAGPDDPGSPWAIGSRAGGHTSIDPGLGTLEDFDAFVAAASAVGIDVALDFAIQCSPDHPWVEEHPDWFEHRADGSIRCAENPPYEYPDVYRIDFDTPDRVGLYTELYRILFFWIERGVKAFRVDNPHTKPVTFWEWIIAKVHAAHPEVIFLAEAFTRPKMMKALSKAGFTQTYSYFTWRNEKKELEEYIEELATTEVRRYFLPNFFANTHDVLSEFLQKGGPAAFRLRLVLAATLSPSYGIYSGYELCEADAVPGTESYLHSEIFEIKRRDYDAPGNLNDLLTRLNRVRRENPALQEFDNVEILETDSDQVVAYCKRARRGGNTLLVVVNLDPFAPRYCTVTVPPGSVGRAAGERYGVTDLLTGERYSWGEKNYVRLDPAELPAHILLVEEKSDAGDGAGRQSP